MADSDFSELVEVAAKLSAVLAGPDMRRLTFNVAKAAKADALSALDSDLPGRKFTNWRPKLSVGFELDGDTSARLAPRPSGPWKVLDVGRSPGRKYVKKRRRVIGWGATQGKHTWSNDVVPTVGRETPGRVDKEIQASIRKALS